MNKCLMKLACKVFSYFKELHQRNIYIGFRKKYDLHSSFLFNGDGILMYGEGIIKIDENSYIGRFSIIQSSKGCQINIGKNCKIGPRFSIWTQSSYVDHDYNNENEIQPKLGNITIQDAVWIGANVVISPGITIGENSIIGANSVVTKNIPPYAIAGGVPAKIIRYKNLSK